MINPAEYIASGILELYMLGATSAEENREVEELAAAYPEIRNELDAISIALEEYAHLQAIEPHATIKPLLFATLDYTKRLTNGEAPSFPPQLNEHSAISDYSEWLDRKDLNPSDSFDKMHVSIIGYTPAMTTAIVRIREMAPDEVHTDEFEKFLIIEGTCDITIGEKVHSLKAGDYLAIPLHENHFVKVTSEIPCKVILQRIAA